MNRGRLWMITGLALAVLTVLQFTGVIEDPTQFICDMLRRRCNP